MNRFALFVVLLAAISGRAEAATAEQLYAERRLPESQAAFEQRVAANPRDASAHYHLGRLAVARRELTAAIPHFERAVSLAPDNPDYHFQFGAACLQHADRLGKTLRALSLARRGRAALEKSVELDPSNAAHRQGLIEFYAKAPGLAGGGLDKAYAQAAALRERAPRAGMLAVAGLKLREAKPAEALALYEAWLQDAPDDYQVLYLVGRTSAETGMQLEHGIAALRRCLALTPPPRTPGHAQVNHYLGIASEKRGDLAAARAAYESTLAIEPEHTPARDALARLP